MAFNPEKCLKIHSLQNGLYVGLNASKVDNSKYFFSKTGKDDDWVQDGLTLQNGEFAYVKGTNYPSKGDNIDTDTNGFQMIGKYDVSGSIMSLVDDGAGELDTITQDYGFAYLFGGQITHVLEPILTAKHLSKGCYKGMFMLCAFLEEVPEFFLPAEELQPACYNSMFMSCERLKGPIRITGKELKATCCYQMFYNCKAFDKVYTYFQDWLDGATFQWLNYTKSGTFYCSKFLKKEIAESHIPSDWKVEEYRVKGSVNPGFQYN